MKRRKDLLGRTISTRKPRLQAVLERHDKLTLGSRLARIKWLQEIAPSGYGMVLPFESAFVFEEAKGTFMDGHFVSTLLLAMAFLEHWLGDLLAKHGYEKQAGRGLKSIIDTLRKHGLADGFLLDQADRMRLHRNPFVHLKEFDHPHKLDRRVRRDSTDPYELLEADARTALSLMYQVATGKGTAARRL